jgi:hypothetical protein
MEPKLTSDVGCSLDFPSREPQPDLNWDDARQPGSPMESCTFFRSRCCQMLGGRLPTRSDRSKSGIRTRSTSAYA